MTNSCVFVVALLSFVQYSRSSWIARATCIWNHATTVRWMAVVSYTSRIQLLPV